ncbi:MAG: hypothetical protein QM783_05520 [Phycisphaerales bacterium]
MELDYCSTELRQSPEVVRRSSLVDLPGLGKAGKGAAVFQPAFVVVPRSSLLQMRRIDRDDGTVWWAMDQLANPSSVVVRLSGAFEPRRALITGEVSSAYGDGVAMAVGRCFQAAARRMWTRSVVFWGVEALSLARQGWRATQDVQSPVEYDLQVP